MSDFVQPFSTVWRKHDLSLNLVEPEVEELDTAFLKNLRSVFLKLQTFPEEFFVYLGLSIKWPNLYTEPKIFSDEKGMLDFSLSFLFFLDMTFMSLSVEISDLDFLDVGDFSSTNFVSTKVVPGHPNFVKNTKDFRQSGDYVYTSTSVALP